MRGIVDEILTLSDGSMAPLDYKFAEYKERTYKTYFIQSLCYAALITENYNMPVKKGFIVYTRSKNRLIEIKFKDTDMKFIKQKITEILYIIRKGFYPKKTSAKAKCGDCAYKNICV